MKKNQCQPEPSRKRARPGCEKCGVYHAEIVCFDKAIRIPCPDGNTLMVYGETKSKGLKLMSCTQAYSLLRKKCPAFLAHIVDTRKETLKLEDIPIIRDFPEVFPEDVSGLPPIRQVEL